MRVLITGADGFIGKNLRVRLATWPDIEIRCYTREDRPDVLPSLLSDVDFVFHLAGANRPKDPQEFADTNVSLTETLCRSLLEIRKTTGKAIPILFTSSVQAERDNAYGRSKKKAEEALFEAKATGDIPVYIYRLPNVFGKWCRPNYNSAVATFCNNTARGVPIEIHDEQAKLTLVYIDDVIDAFLAVVNGQEMDVDREGFSVVSPEYVTTVGEVAQQIKFFHEQRHKLMTGRVGSGLVRALYATYISYLPVELFAYEIPQFVDERGKFVEMLRTPDSGQISFLTAGPGVTRGGHYHDTKTEKFLVLRGQARFRFKNILTGEYYEIQTSDEKSEVVETIPGWTHDITNVGSDELIVMLWANEIFDRNRPDTFSRAI